MRPIHLVAALVLLACGLCGLWCWIDFDAREARAFDARDTDAAARAASDVQRGETDEARGESAAQGRTALLAAVLAPDAKSAEDDKPRAKPRVTGRVVGPDGAGVPGALVWASTSSYWVQLPLDVEPEGLPTSWIKLSKAECDAEGRFTIEDLKPGALRVAARAPGFAPTYLDHLDLPQYEKRELADIRLEPGVAVSGKIIGNDGKGVAGARVLIALDCVRKSSIVAVPGRGVPAGTSDADGGFTVDQLAAGPWHLLIDAPGYLVAECDGRTERAGEHARGIVVRLETGVEIRGRISAKDVPVPTDLRISARLLPEARGNRRDVEPNDDNDGPPKTTNEIRARFATVDAEGAFAVTGLKPLGRYRLSAAQKTNDERGWKPSTSIEGANATAGDKGVELVYKPESVLVLRVLDDATGAPLANFTVFAGVGRERPLRDDKGEVRHAFDGGQVRFPELRPPQQGGKLVLLRVRADGYKDHENKNVALKPAMELDLGDIRLVREHVVLATVVDDATGAPVPEARVVLAAGKSDEDLANLSSTPPEQDLFGDATIQYARAGKNGQVRLTSSPGKMTSLQASAKGFLPSDPLHVLLPSDKDHALELRVKHGGVVIAKVTDGFGHPVAGVGIQHRLPRVGADQDESIDDSNKSDADGVVKFDALLPGVHGFQVHEEQGDVYFWNKDGMESEPRTMWVESVVSAGSSATLEFKAPPRGSISGHVREGGRTIEGAHVKLVPRSDEREHERGMAYWGGRADPFSTVTDHAGAYKLENVRCGEYTALVTHSGRRMAAEFPLQVAPEPRAYELVLEIAGVEGRVTDPDGRPLAGLVVNAYRARGGLDVEPPYHMVVVEDERGNPNVNWEQVTRGPERTDSQGRYALTGVLTDEPLYVQVEGEWVEHKTSPEITLSHDETRAGVDFKLRLAGKIEIAMSGGVRNKNDAWFQVKAVRAGDPPEQVSYQTVVATWNRSQSINSVLPGKYKVTIRLRGNDQSPPLVEQEIDVSAGALARVAFQP